MRAGLTRSELDRIVGAVEKRVFLLHNVHAKSPEIFKTRWAMAYLRGPITRARLTELNQLVGAELSSGARRETAAIPAPSRTAADARPSIPDGIQEYFLPNNLTVSEAIGAGQHGAAELVYRPQLLAQASARILDRKLSLDHELAMAALAPRAGRLRWEEHLGDPIDPQLLQQGPVSQSSFAELDESLKDPRKLKALEKDFADFVYHAAELRLLWNPELELVAQPGTARQDFERQVAQAAQQARDQQAKEIRRKYQKKLETLRSKLSREERDLAEDQAELSARKMEEMATHAENILGLFTGSRSRRRVSSSLTKRRLSAKAKADVEESAETIEQFNRQLEQLEAELAEELDELDDRWMELAGKIDELVKTPYKKDIYIELFGLAWTPYWQVEQDGKMLQVPAFRT